MSRNPHIRPEQIEMIVQAIQGWPHASLSWEDVRKLSRPILGFVPSRSGISAHADIQKAYQDKGSELSKAPAERLPAPRSLATASRLIASRDAEIAELKQQIVEFREKFDRWRYNAHLMNLKIDKLDNPLPAISRKE
jgi:hypothetical protein